MWPAGGSVFVEVFDDDPAGSGVLLDSWSGISVEPDDPDDLENPFGSFWLSLAELDPAFDLMPGMFVRVSDEDGGDPVPSKETVVLDLSVTLPVVPGGTVVSGMAVEAEGDVWVQVHAEDAEPVTAVFSDASNWTATFPGPIELGMNGSAWQEETSDPDGDRTEVWWSAPNPSFSVDPVGNRVWGDGWTPGSVAVSIGGLSWPAVADSGGHFDLDLHGFYDVVEGDVVEVSDTGSLVKTHTVTGLSVAGVIVVDDEVTGTAVQDSLVWVNIHGSEDPDVVVAADFDVYGDGSAWVWTAGFPAGSIDDETQGYAYQPDGDGDQTQVDWPVQVPEPPHSFGVDPLNDQVFGWGWPADGSVLVEVFDVGWNGTDPALRTYPGVVVAGDSNFNLDLTADPAFDVESGMYVVVSDESGVFWDKDHVVTDVAFTGIDAEFDVVSGTTSAVSPVWVNVHESGFDDTEAVLVGGEWDATMPFDIDDETQGYAYQRDFDGDRTHIDWPYIPEQNFNVFVDESMVHAYQWPLDAAVTLTVQHPTVVIEDFEDGDAAGWVGSHGSMTVVEDPVNPNGGLYVGKATMIPPDCAGQSLPFGGQMPDRFSVDFLAGGDTSHSSGLAFRLFSSEAAGHIASISYHTGELRWYDGAVYQTIMAASADTWYRIELRNIDWSAHTYDIWVNDVEQYPGAAFIDPAGYLDKIQAYACDVATGNDVYLDNITLSTDGVWGAVFYTDTQSSIEAPWDDTQSFAQFDLPDTVGAGDLVTVSGDVSGSPVVKEHVVTELAFTGVNVDTDTVSGTAADGSTVWVNVHGSTFEDVQETATGGVWDAVLPFDIVESTNGYASQRDPDGDQTQIQWPTPPPPNRFSVDPVGNRVWGDGWTPGSVAVSIGGLSWPAVADSGGHFDLDLHGFYDVVEGDVVEVSDTGSLVKTHTVTGLSVAGVIVVDDEVTGTAVQDSLVWVNIHGSEDPDVVVAADFDVYGDGSAWVWTAGFPAGSIDDETQGYAYQPDDDGDQTQMDWPVQIPEPPHSFGVDPLNDQVFGWGWPADGSVLVEVWDLVGGTMLRLRRVSWLLGIRTSIWI